MKRTLSDSEDSVASDTESDIFEDDDLEEILRGLSPRVPRKRALDFLHTLASCKKILYWNSHGEMMYHQRRIPVTNISELIEYAILPYSLDIKAPRGLNTFIKGLLEVGIDKKLIGNKRVLADLVARQPDEVESDLSDDETSDSSEIQETDSEEEDEENEQENESIDSSSDNEVEECHICRDFKPFYSIPVVQCPKCLWREAYYCRDNQLIKCDICYHSFPVDAHTTKVKFIRCQDCEAVFQMSPNSKTLKLMDNHSNKDHEEIE